MARYALVLNAGSSSIKYAVIDADTGNQSVYGRADNLGSDRAVLYTYSGDNKAIFDLDQPNHAGALETILKIVNDAIKSGDVSAISAVGHRVTHGGEVFKQAAMLNEDVMTEIEKCKKLAPLHIPPQLEAIQAAMEVFDGVPHVAVFDTSFHQSMPEKAFLYALPYEFYSEHNLRKYGMHGTSFRHVTETMKDILNNPTPNLIIVQLGAGGSVDAVANGKSADTTMGITPLAGIIHGHRSGDIDPALPAIVADNLGMEMDEMNHILRNRSGLLGISGISSDSRVLEESARGGHKRAQIALDIYAYLLAKNVAGMMVALPKAPDAIVFSGDVGVNSPYIRGEVIAQLKFLDITLDTELNNQAQHGKEGIISTPDSKIPCHVMATNAELVIARDAMTFSKLPPS